MYDSFQDIFLGHYTFHVLNQLECLINFLILKVIDYQVEASFRDHINQGWQDLESILSTSEDNQVMSQ